MGKKWVKVDPAELKPMDRFKAVNTRDKDTRSVVTGVVRLIEDGYVTDSCGGDWASGRYHWFRRKPKPAKPSLTMPTISNPVMPIPDSFKIASDCQETQARLDDAMLTVAEQNTELANLRRVLADTQNAGTTPTPTADRYDGHGVEYWYNRYARQLAHSEQLQAANKNRRQKMQLLKKEAKDARAQVQGWESRYGVLSASFVESDYLHAETQAQLDDAMLTIAGQRTELANLRKVLADVQNATPLTPLTRPEEPPVGTFFRVERTGNVYLRRVCQGGDCASDYLLVEGYHNGLGPSCTGHWHDFTEPGDTITRLSLVEATDD